MSKKSKIFLILVAALVVVAIVVLCVSLLENDGTPSSSEKRELPSLADQKLSQDDENITLPEDEPQRLYPPQDVH